MKKYFMSILLVVAIYSNGAHATIYTPCNETIRGYAQKDVDGSTYWCDGALWTAREVQMPLPQTKKGATTVGDDGSFYYFTGTEWHKLTGIVVPKNLSFR